jgi:electron transfer flavoprotein alpha subunit
VSGILALVEHEDGRPDRLTLEALTIAGRLGTALGTTVEAALLGPGADGAAPGLGAYGVATAHVIAHDRLDAYAPAAWAAGLEQVVADGSFDAVVAPGSERGIEVLAHLAARAGLPMAANVIDVEPGERWKVTRQRWAGSLLEEAWLDGTPHVLTVAPHAVAPLEPLASAAPAAVVPRTPVLSDSDLRVRVSRQVPAAADSVALADAKVVVGGGRGIGSAEGFAMLEELASLLGGAVGVSRVATSLGWRPHAEQIGQTGARIAPDLYIACGISGAIQHIVGCKAAKRILVINKDADAPIFSRATYAVVGDVHTVVPAISAEIRRTRGA